MTCPEAEVYQQHLCRPGWCQVGE